MKLLAESNDRYTRCLLLKDEKVSHLFWRVGQNNKGNIYRGKIVRIEPGLQAAFVEYEGEVGFLSYYSIHPEYFSNRKEFQSRLNKEHCSTKESLTYKSFSIERIMSVGQEVLVQVIRSAYGDKKPMLSTFLVLQGRYIKIVVNSLKPFCNVKNLSINQKTLMQKLFKEYCPLSNLTVNCDFRLSSELLQEEFLSLARKMQKIKKKEPLLLEENLMSFLLKTYEDISEVLLETKKPISSNLLAERKVSHGFNIMKDYENFWQSLQENTVTMENGYLLFSFTPLGTCIDVNSNKVFRQTPEAINLKASQEICKQIILRNICGLIIIDFLDAKHEKDELEKIFREEFQKDKIKIQIGSLSEFCTLQIARQHQENENVSFFSSCTSCTSGHIIRTEMVGEQILREISYRADNLDHMEIHCSFTIGEYILNRCKQDLLELENNLNIKVDFVFFEGSSTRWELFAPE